MESTNGTHAAGNGEPRPRKRQRQTGGDAQSIPIHPDLQGAAVGSPLQNALQQSLRQGMDTDPSDYPRRRAVIACEVCRGRKTRCDGGKPKCRLCTDLGAECVYREPGQKLDVGDKLILERLDRLEGFLHHFNQTASLASSLGSSHRLTRAHKPASTFFDEVANSTLTSSLLSQPVPGSSLAAELGRAEFPIASREPTDHAAVASRIESYFARMHEIHGLVNPSTWQAVYATASLGNFIGSIEACTVLLLAALGSCAAERTLLAATSPDEAPGAAYFAKAWAMLPEITMSGSIAAIQCLILGSLYLLEIHRPVDAWNTAKTASSKLDLHLAADPDPFGPENEQIRRLYWNLHLVKWSLFSSLDLPATGSASDSAQAVGLPGAFSSSVREDGDSDEPILLLAQVQLQQLAERISKAFPSSQSTTFNIDSMYPTAVHFDDLLTQWYDRLPEPLAFSHEGLPTGGAIQNTLRHGFFACRAAIYRPFVMAMVEDSDLSTDNAINSCCKKCLEASVRQIEYTSALQAEQLSWKAANDIVAETLFLTAATTVPALAAMLPPAGDLKTRLIDHVAAEIDKLCPGSPALAVKMAVLRSAEEKRATLRGTNASHQP